MSCACEKCLQHARTLGLAEGTPTKEAIRKAFRAAASLWHPDRFENDPAQRLEAEEKFKAIQCAYSELTEHFESPLQPFVEPVSAQSPAEDFFAGPSHVEKQPHISFGGAHGCYVAPDFPAQALKIAYAHVHEPDRPLALVDLSRHGSPLGDLSRYILFSLRGIFVCDTLQQVSLLWYEDLGELRFVDQRKQGKLPLRHRFIEKISGTEQKYSLEIYRRGGTLFYAIASQADDSVKKVIYNFLKQKSPLPHL
jgi:DnaJ domain